MNLGYQRPLFLMPFDHRMSFVKGMGFAPPLTAAQKVAVMEAKNVIYEGLRLALTKGADEQAAGVLVDEEFGTAILRDAKGRGLVTCVAVEQSGQEEFAFEYGNQWRQHIEAFAPTFAKVLIRYNPEGDKAMNRRQSEHLKELSDYCHQCGYRFLIELLVPMTREQSDRLSGDYRIYDRNLRPPLMIAGIRELQDEGVEPDVWKVEGLDQCIDCQAVVATARRNGRNGVGCIVLGRGSDESSILAWFRAAAPVPGFIGFAVGRTTFWEAVSKLHGGQIGREGAITQIADRYLEWVRAFKSARDECVFATTVPECA